MTMSGNLGEHSFYAPLGRRDALSSGREIRNNAIWDIFPEYIAYFSRLNARANSRLS
jgi:hypothetical protein